MDLLNLLTSPAGIAVLAAAAAVFFFCLTAIGRSRRLRRSREVKKQAREYLMHARRAARSPCDANRVEGFVRRIRYLAEKNGFELCEIGASKRGLDRLMTMAKDRIEPRSIPVYHDIWPTGLPGNHLALPGPTRPAHELELDLPAEGGAEEEMVITMGSAAAVEAQSPDAFGNSIEIEVELPELGPEAITSYFDPSAPDERQAAAAACELHRTDISVEEAETAISRIVANDSHSDDVDVDALFDRIIIPGNGIDAKAKVVHIVKGDN